jgi:hypothetical protein
MLQRGSSIAITIALAVPAVAQSPPPLVFDGAPRVVLEVSISSGLKGVAGWSSSDVINEIELQLRRSNIRMYVGMTLDGDAMSNLAGPDPECQASMPKGTISWNIDTDRNCGALLATLETILGKSDATTGLAVIRCSFQFEAWAEQRRPDSKYVTFASLWQRDDLREPRMRSHTHPQPCCSATSCSTRVKKARLAALAFAS